MGLPFTLKRRNAASGEFAGVAPLRDVSLATLLLFCALLFPFILSYHRYPIPSFYQEWLAIILALAAAILIAAKYRGEHFELPFSVVIPLALLPSVVFHLVAGNALIAHGPPLHLIWIGSAILLMIIGRKLGSASAAVSLADVMAAAFVAGALASCVATWHWHLESGVFDTLPWGAAAGWIAQRNQNALHLWLGVLGISHFALNRKLSWPLFLVGLGMLIEAASHTESRSVFLYAGCGLVLGIWAATKSSLRELRMRLLLIGICPLIMLVAIQGVQSLAQRTPGPDSSLGTGAIQRYAPATVNQDPRLGLWLTASRIALSNPMSGTGPGSFIRESWIISDSLPDKVQTVIPSTHAHNLFLQIGAELGAPTALAMAVLILVWLYYGSRQTDWQGNWLHIAIPITILVHNQVEYSLWYLNFLVPAALSMGASNQRKAGKGVPAFAMLAAAILGLGLAARLGQDYRELEAALADARSGHGEIGRLLAAANHPVFGAWASTEIAGQAWPTGITPEAQDAHAVRALFVSPLKKASLARYADALETKRMLAAAATDRRVTRRVFGSK